MDGVSYTLLLGLAPAPPPVVEAVESIEIETSTELASILRLRLGLRRTELGDWSLLELDLFRPMLPISVRIQTGLGLPQAVINAFASLQRLEFAADEASAVLEVTAMDATLKMNLQEKVMAWPNMPDSLIATTIFGQQGIVPRVTPTTPVLTLPEGITTQRGTDIRFLRRLAARNGFECYVQPEPLSGIDQGFFGPRQLLGVPQAVLNVSMGPDTNVSEFHVRYEMTRPTAATAWILDETTKTPQPGLAPASLQVPMGVEPSLFRVVPPPMVQPVETGLTRFGSAQAAAQGIVDRSSFAVVAEGTVGASAGVLRPGGLVNVRGAGRAFNGSYYLTKVNHSLSQGGYVQRFEARRNAVGMTGAELFVEAG
jgi:hypothetical protein